MIIHLVESHSLNIDKLSVSSVRNDQKSVLYLDGLLWLNLRDMQVMGKENLVIDLELNQILQSISQKFQNQSTTNYFSVIIPKFATIRDIGNKKIELSELNIGSVIDICLEISFRLHNNLSLMFGQAEEILIKGRRFCGENNI